ncbi:hypothetical protein MMC28_010425 [Mycoblastus sanguinarius]|nr:hypothetical protein [Mycoblastus sanguinarius]
MCLPYIITEPQPRSRVRRAPPISPLLPETTETRVIDASESAQIIYRTPSSNRRRQPVPRRSPTIKSRPSPEMEYLGGFVAGQTALRREEERITAEAIRKSAPPTPVVAPPVQVPLTTLPPPPPPPPPLVPVPPLAPVSVPAPKPALPPPRPPTQTPLRPTRPSYTYIRRPPHRRRSRSCSTCDSSNSRRSFLAVQRRVHSLWDRVSNLEQWRVERDVERRWRKDAWEKERDDEERRRLDELQGRRRVDAGLQGRVRYVNGRGREVDNEVWWELGRGRGRWGRRYPV